MANGFDEEIKKWGLAPWMVWAGLALTVLYFWYMKRR